MGFDWLISVCQQKLAILLFLAYFPGYGSAPFLKCRRECHHHPPAHRFSITVIFAKLCSARTLAAAAVLSFERYTLYIVAHTLDRE